MPKYVWFERLRIVKRTGLELVLIATLPKSCMLGVMVNGVGDAEGVADGVPVGVDVAVAVGVAATVAVGEGVISPDPTSTDPLSQLLPNGLLKPR